MPIGFQITTDSGYSFPIDRLQQGLLICILNLDQEYKFVIVVWGYVNHRRQIKHKLTH